MDVVSDVLRVAGVRGTIGARVEAGGAWAVANQDPSGAYLHAVTEGDMGLPAEPGRKENPWHDSQPERRTSSRSTTAT